MGWKPIKFPKDTPAQVTDSRTGDSVNIAGAALADGRVLVQHANGRLEVVDVNDLEK